MKRFAGALLALAMTIQVSAVQAADAPLITPTRDVDVIYRMAGPASEIEQRLRWGVSQGKLRVDPPTPGLFVIIDTVTHAVEAVRESDHIVLQLAPGTAVTPPGLPAAGAALRKGEAQVAGLACTEWQMTDTSGRPILVCITPDGVMLRAEADGLVLAEAVEVRFAPLPEAVFRVPGDYKRIIPPPLSQKPR